MLGHAGTVLYCAEVLTPEVVSCAGAGAVAGAGAGAGAGVSAWRRFAFCLLIARVHLIWLVYCACQVKVFFLVHVMVQVHVHVPLQVHM